MIRVRIATPERITLTEAGHVDVALCGNDDKIQIMVTMGVYFYEAHIIALDDEAAKCMPQVLRRIETTLRQMAPLIEIDIFKDGRIWCGERFKGQYNITIGRPETLVVSA